MAMDRGWRMPEENRQAYRSMTLLGGLLAIFLIPAPTHAQAAGRKVDFFRLRAPGDAYDIAQASDLHYGRLGDRHGLWMVCDRNGRESAGKIYFFSLRALAAAPSGGTLVADDAFTIVAPSGDWAAFAAANRGAGEAALADVRRRIVPAAERKDEPFLDLEAVTIGAAVQPPHEPRLFVVAEEPYSVILELTLEGGGQNGRARLMALYGYDEPPEHQGAALNDGLEGFAWAGRPGWFYFAEEGTRSHTEEARPRIMFREPILGLGELKDGRLAPDRERTEALSAAVRRCRRGAAQTLNALAVLRDGRILAVDRNGGCILHVDPAGERVAPWLDLYAPHGGNLRELLAGFPRRRKMPYVSIEGLAVDDAGALWLVDDPAIPEGWRESCLVRIRGGEPLDSPRRHGDRRHAE